MNSYTDIQKLSELNALVMEARQGARMLRDDQEITPELIEQIFARFKGLLSRIGKSETWAARSMAIGASTLSQVLSGNYAGDTEAYIRKIDKWTEVQISREETPKPDGFARTSVASKIIFAANVAMKTSRISVVHGPSGVGKTAAAEFIRSDVSGSILISITTAGAGITAIYDMLASELKLPAGRMTCYQREMAVIEVLKGTNRLIIVDEIHKLCIRKKDSGLHVLRDLQGKTDCPMLWIGTADIADYLESGKEGVEAIEQIYGRVNFWVDLTSQANGNDGEDPGCHTIEDVRKVLAAKQIKTNSGADNYLFGMSNMVRLGGLRTAVSLCQLALIKNNNITISRELLEDIQVQRLGRRAAAQVEAKLDIWLKKRKLA